MSVGAVTFDVLPFGERAVLLDFADAEARGALTHWLIEHAPAAVQVVPAERTVLLQVCEPGVTTEQSHALLSGILRQLPDADVSAHETAPAAGTRVGLDVVYDGPDLADAANALGMSVDELVTWHTEDVWDVEFLGFMPGFGYLTRSAPSFDIPRRSSPRTRIPAGSVGLAGRYCGVYPGASPGGWQLIGTTTRVMFDPGAGGALLAPGDRVQFRAAGPTVREHA